jgi:hypothetical protein
MDIHATEIINKRADHYQRKEFPVPATVKKVTPGKKKSILPLVRETPVESKNKTKKNEELGTIKQH